MKKLAMAVGVVLLLSTIVLAGKNLADYPLQIEIVESHWHRHRDGSVDGWGQGNIIDGDSIHAFDFSYYAGAPFHRTIGDAHYLAKWKKDQLKLEMLVGQIGSPDKFESFDLKTRVREDVYMRSPEGAVAVSQAEYKAKQQQK
jgi:hypothetical protein